MIKEIIFKNTNDFSAKPITLSFSKNVNVIIGPKGGGKSTLFDLISGLKKNYISDNVLKALETYNLKFEKAIKFSNEEILVSQLTKKTKKEKEEDYKKRNDVIYQDDQIKKDLTNIKDIEKNKFEYLKNQVEISPNISEFILKIKNLWLAMNNINDYFQKNEDKINWSNTFKIKDLTNKDHLSVITKLDYQNNNLKNIIDEELSEYKKILNSINEYDLKLKRLKIIPKDNVIKNNEFEQKITEQIDLILKENSKLVNLIQERNNLIERIYTMSNLFSLSYKKVMEKIKSEYYSSSGLKSYEIQSKNHFKNLACDIYKTIKNFEWLISNDIYLHIENKQNQTESLIYKIEDSILLNDDARYSILLTVFNSPGNSKDDIGKWLKSLTEKGVKDFDEDKIKKAICRELKDKVQVYVEFNNQKQNYESLSLGQKSIYGLKYKFNKSIKDDLYLDQPEDNLDNNTIAQEILPMIKQKKQNQVFIVTHNANIGILTNPDQVIIADLNNSKNPYVIANLLEVINNESAHYLEGGKEYLKQRYQKIINNVEEN